ncbi:MAG: NAD(+)/NADH kinase, partial [Candidatus Hermodarchaeota archaeon]
MWLCVERDEIIGDPSAHQQAKRVISKISQREKIKTRFILREEVTLDIFLDVDLIITLGGDGTFLTAGLYIFDDTPLLGVATNPTSEAFLLKTTALSIQETIEAFLKDKLQPVVLPRVKVKGRKPQAVNEVYFGRDHAYKTLDYSLRTSRFQSWDPQRAYGCIVATGLGSTAGYGSLTQGDFFDPLSKELRFTISGPSLRGRTPTIKKGVIKKGEKLYIRNETPHDTILSFDSNIELPVQYNEEIFITLSDQPLHVIEPGLEITRRKELSKEYESIWVT